MTTSGKEAIAAKLSCKLRLIIRNFIVSISNNWELNCRTKFLLCKGNHLITEDQR